MLVAIAKISILAKLKGFSCVFSSSFEKLSFIIFSPINPRRIKALHGYFSVDKPNVIETANASIDKPIAMIITSNKLMVNSSPIIEQSFNYWKYIPSWLVLSRDF